MDAQRPQAGAGNVQADRIELLRRWILGVLVLGLLGTVTELVLLEHYDTASRRAVQIVMALFVLAGFVGFVAHFYGSAEYQLELNPEMSNWELMEKVLRAKAPPLLAPGMMLQLGLLGLAYMFSDSRFRRSEMK
jgi:hypothetical protein